MDITLSEEEVLFKRSVDEFVERELPREVVRQWEHEHHFDEAIWARWAELGWIGLPFPTEFGGGGARTMFLVLLAEGLGRRGYDLALNLTVPVFLGLNVLKYGSEELRQRLIPALIRGEVRFTGSFTEPQAGSDLAAIQTRGRVEGDEIVLNGHKVFSSGSHRPATMIMVACRTNPEAANPRAGLSVVLVPNDSPGLEIRPMRTLGRHVFATNELFFDEVRVPRANVLGELDDGWRVLMSGFELERAMISATYVGNAQAIVEDAVAYAKQREQFGRPIGKFQAIAHMLVDMHVGVEGARLLTYRLASLLDRGVPCFAEASMAKLASSETLVAVANQGMQVLGGYGYTEELDMERFFRAARVTTVAGGSSQIQRNAIARSLGL